MTKPTVEVLKLVKEGKMRPKGTLPGPDDDEGASEGNRGNVEVASSQRAKER